MCLMASILFGLAAVAIPVIIHLLHRQTTSPIAWGAWQFLLETTIQQKRRRRIEHWLLLLARMSVVALVVLALSRPVILPEHYNPLAKNMAIDVGLVVDHSLSMGRRIGPKTLLDEAIAQAERVAGQLHAGDTFSIVLAEHRPRELTPVPVQGDANVHAVCRKLHELKAGLSDASIPQAVQAARALVNRGRNIRKLIIVLSDEQRSTWSIDDTTGWRSALGDKSAGGLDPHLAVFSLPMSPAADVGNLAVGDLRIHGNLVCLNRATEITATITNTSSVDMPAAAIRLIVDGKPASLQESPALRANQARGIRFEHTFTEPGSHWVQVRADAVDALEADNIATAALMVHRKLPVLVVDGQLTGAGDFRSSQFLEAAMQPVDPSSPAAATTLVQPKIVSVSDCAGINLDEYAVVVVNDVPQLPADFLDRLGRYVRGGHGAWFILGQRATSRLVNEDLARAGLFSAQLGELKRSGTPAAVEVADLRNAMVSLLTASQRNSMTGVTNGQWWQLRATSADERVVLSAAGGDPLVFEREISGDGGRVVLWATSVDGTWNNWPLSNVFVPLVHETLYHLAVAQIRQSDSLRVEAGHPLVWTGAASASLDSASISRPDLLVATATAVATTRPAVIPPVKVSPVVRGGRPVITWADAAEPGVYKMEFNPASASADGPVYYSVALDRRELDPAVVSATDLAWLKEQGYIRARITGDGISEAMGSLSPGSELWPWLAALLVLMLIWETYLVRRAVRLQAHGNADSGLGAPVIHVGH